MPEYDKTALAYGLEEWRLSKWRFYKSNLQSQCNLNQNSKVIFHKEKINNPQIHKEAEKIPGSCSILEQNE